MADELVLLECPMCDFTVLPSDDYILQLHFEQMHTTDSPFLIQDDSTQLLSLPPRPSSASRDIPSSDEEEEETVACPEPDCGEVVLLIDFNEHLDYHSAESLSFDDTGNYTQHSSATMQSSSTANSSSHTRHPKDAFSESNFNTNLVEASKHGGSHKLKKHGNRVRRGSEKSTLSRSINAFNPFAKFDKEVKPPVKSARLGKSELGPYAWESRMPTWLHDQLEAGPKVTVANRIGRDGRLIKQDQVQNETPGIIPILAQLSALDRGVKHAYYCHPSTLHIGKTPKEGSFCGYRNIQMLLSYIQGSKAQGHEEFPGRTPGILKLQDIIEESWDKGVNSIGRIQTGGIRDTRKYIGTPEAQALFVGLQINCAVETFGDLKDRKIEAHEVLFDRIERYFAQAAVPDGSKVYKTLLPPIYLQQPGHSMTIVGFERRQDGSSNLVVFDPSYSTSPAMHKLLGRKNISSARPEAMHSYRRGAMQLRKHAAFEILVLTATPPLYPAWEVLRTFPDCRYVYVFFRSRTLGYDVYPEDYFLPNFPWQQYGGLWICDEARFARSEPLNALTAQALRRITGEGASYRSDDSPTSPTSSFTSSSFHQLPSASAHMTEEAYTQLPSYVPSLDGSMSGAASFLVPSTQMNSGPVFNMGAVNAALPQPEAIRPKFSLLTDVGRKYPGFPTPLSPTQSAKVIFPSPASDTGSGAATPRATSPAMRSVSPMSIDGSSMCGPSRRCLSHGFEHYASSMPLIDSMLATTQPTTPFSPLASPRAPSTAASLSSSSPQRPMSPRSAMLKTMSDKQGFHASPPRYPSLYSRPLLTIDTHSSPTSLSSSPRHWPHDSPSFQTIEIANGTETSTSSPLSETGQMLIYTSHRPASSGLLSVRPLSEVQVAEYRFWHPCGHRRCAFGCGAAHEGEWAAAKRLFRGVEEVKEGCYDGFGFDGQSESVVLEQESWNEEGCGASAWAGVRMVKDWSTFLSQCDREGVAAY